MRGVVGVILAGGRSSRMGSDKALVKVGGRPMVEWVARAMSDFSPVVMVGRRQAPMGLMALPDHHPGPAGPLAGLYTALAAFKLPVVVVAVDQPLVRAETLSELARRANEDRTAVCIDQVAQVTCASYSPQCLAQAARLLGAGGSIRDLLRSEPWTRIEPQEWSSWGEDGRSWFSMDSPEDILAAERKFRVRLVT